MQKWELIERFGWTIPEVEALSIGDFEDYETWKVVKDAVQKAGSFLRPKPPEPPKRRR